MEKIIAHVASHVSLIGYLPQEIAPNAVIRRASEQEIIEFDRRNALAASAISFHGHSYRHTYEEIVDGDSIRYVPRLLPEAEWRYWVIEHEGDGLIFNRIEQLLTLSMPSIFLSFATIAGISSPLEGTRPLAPHILERVESLWRNGNRESQINVSRLVELCSNLQNLSNLDEENMFVQDALRKFFDLQRLPSMSEMYCLGLFSIIESLLAHSPRLNESLDSINHQLVNKLQFLNAEIIHSPIDPSTFFAGIDHDKLWKKLYNYRSQIAHTSKRHLSADHKALKSAQSITDFVEAKTKELLILALKKPSFLRHLKSC